MPSSPGDVHGPAKGRNETDPVSSAPAIAIAPQKNSSLCLLIVDDEAAITELLQEFFEEQGFKVLTAHNGAEAIRLAESASVNIALVDLVLPDISGYEIVQRFRELKKDISSIMMTAFASVENLVTAVNLRVRGFVLKPLDPPAVLARVLEVADIHRLEEENRNLLDALETSYAEVRELYRKEHRIADILQHALLPALPVRFHDFAVGQHYSVAMEDALVGGDVYDLFALEDNRTGILMADVSGKGLNAAVEMGLVRNSVRALAMVCREPTEVIRQFSRIVAAQQDFSGFVTVFFGVFERDTRRLLYVNAGHEPPLLRTASSGEINALESTGPIVGLSHFDELDYSAAELFLDPGDILLLFTDGLTEVRGMDSNVLVRQLGDWLNEVADQDAVSAARSLFLRCHERAPGNAQDDQAILLLKYQPQSQRA